jgi:hypothetical protein
MSARPDHRMLRAIDPVEEHEMDALNGLVEEGILTPEQGRAVEGALAAPRPRSATLVAEIGGYIGGLLMLGGAMVVVGNSWSDLGRGARVGVLAGFAVAFALAGVLAAGGPGRLPGLARDASPARRRVVGLLLGLAALPAAGAVAAGLTRYAGTWAGLVGLGIAMVGLVLARTAAGLVVTVAASVFAMAAVANEVLHVTVLPGALMTAGLGIVWCVLGALRRVPARTVALSLGAVIALVACTFPVGTVGQYALPLALGVGFFAAYPLVRSIVLLVAGVLAVTDGVTWVVGALAHGVLSQAVTLAVGGATLVAASLVGLGLRRGGPGPVRHQPR